MDQKYIFFKIDPMVDVTFVRCYVIFKIAEPVIFAGAGASKK